MAEQDIPQQLADAERAFVIAAAGCGKTEVITRAVALCTSGRQLVLTHTHAGVWALRRRLAKLGVPRAKYDVETIAGWALRYTSSYPTSSGIETTKPVGPQWNAIYEAGRLLLQRSTIRRVVKASYGGVFVDEYQDCLTIQHGLVMALAEILPCRVLGDPLQGIFNFGGQTPVDWERDVQPSFERLPDLTTPWRWRGDDADPALGDWLVRVRTDLETGNAIDLTRAPVTFLTKSNEAQRQACWDQLQFTGDSVVAIRKWPHDCHAIARDLEGRFTSMEEMDCKDLLSAADTISQTTGSARVLAVLAFAQQCMTGVPGLTTSLQATLRSGKTPRISAQCPHPDLYASTISLASSADLNPALAILDYLEGAPKAHVFRRELLREMRRALRSFSGGGYGSLREAAWAVRNVTRQQGRREEHRSISRTLLIKGLEYDRAVILDADELDVRNLYVALTRARKGLVILASAPTLSPQG